MENEIKRLQCLFGGLDRAYGEFRLDEENLGDKLKKGGKAFTVSKPATAEQWKRHLAGEVGYGVVPIRDDGTVSWACIDVDSYGKDVTSTTNGFIQEYALPFVVCRSKSGGAHVLVFFKEPIPARLVVKKLNEFAKAMGFGDSEIFPKQTKLEPDQYGNWLNMPYFDWEISTRYGLNEKGERLSLHEFLDYCEFRRLSFDGWKALEVPKLEVPFDDGPPCLQTMARQGVVEGQRNAALLQFGVYAQQKYGEDYADKVLEYNERFLSERLPYKELQATVLKSLERRDYGYKCPHKGERTFESVCNRTVCMRRQFGIGGAGDEEFAAEMQLGGLRKLIYYSPLGEPMDDDPDWELTVQNRTLRFTTDQLLDQSKFGKKCMNKLNNLPPRIPNARWFEMIRGKLSDCETIEIPFETSPAAGTLEFLRDFIRENGHARNVLELLNGLALKKEGCYRFRLEALADFIREKARTSVDKKVISDHLKLLGVERKETTAREGAVTMKVVYWSISESQLEIYEKSHTEEPQVNF